MTGPKRGLGGLLGEFRDFIMRGNVLDLAVAVILGGAFGKIIESLVTDVLTPLVLAPALKAAQVDRLAELSAAGVQYGLFLAAILNFLVIAFCIFLLVRSFESFQKRLERKQALADAEAEAAAPPDPTLVAQENLTRAIERLTAVMEERP
ncbi:MAG: large conductance mechanosensitive channel protein MscL [Cyanobacteria bacterium]|nr:large conductance mechanosensitive channel protein MscL [Cyanobacteriota bacterium]